MSNVTLEGVPVERCCRCGRIRNVRPQRTKDPSIDKGYDSLS